MTVIEFIKNFKEFEIGTFVVPRSKPDSVYRIVGMPVFKGMENSRGANYFNTTEEVLKVNAFLNPVGYKVERIDGIGTNSTLYTSYDPLFELYDEYNEKVHPHLIKEHERFNLLIQIQEIKKKLK